MDELVKVVSKIDTYIDIFLKDDELKHEKQIFKKFKKRLEQKEYSKILKKGTDDEVLDNL